MTIHEMPAPAFDAWEMALSAVPMEVCASHHEAGLYLEKPIGAVTFENHRFVPVGEAGDHLLYVRGLLFRRGAA